MLEGDSNSREPRPGPPADPLIGRTLNERFRIVAPIGSGGMGKVYKAMQSPLDRLVALKVLNPNFPAERDPNFKRRFLLEASLTAKLRHTNTVTVIDYGQTDDQIFYIAMEYLEGQTLADLLRHERRIPWTRALQIAQQICRSLREAHSLGVVHRDLKPANVMLLDEGDHDQVKVLDFGLVKSFTTDPGAVSPEVTQQGTFLGSPQYMSPEQARNNADPRSDIYSLGILLYQMMVGRPPFVGKDYLEVIFQHLKEPPAPFAQYFPDSDVPTDVEWVVMKCLQKDPAARFQRMEELLDGMRAAAAMAGTVGLFPDRTSPGFRLPPNFAKTPPPLPVGGAPQPTPGAAAVPAAESSELQPEQTSALVIDGESGLPVWAWLGIVFACALVGLGGVFLFAGGHGKAAQAKTAAVAKTAPAPSAKAKAQVRFHIRTDPPGAHVFLHGKDLGATPLTFSVPPGQDGTVTEELELDEDGYFPLSVVAGGSGDVVLLQKLRKRPARNRRRNRRPSPDMEPAAPSPSEAAPQQLQLAEPTSTPVAVPTSPTPLALPPVPGSSPPQSAAFHSGPLPFGDGMTRPHLVSGPPIRYTAAALAAKVEGTMIVRCTVSPSGTVSDCQAIKALPFMKDAVISTLQKRKYTPVTFQGKPVSVKYVFTIRLVLPQH